MPATTAPTIVSINTHKAFWTDARPQTIQPGLCEVVVPVPKNCSLFGIEPNAASTGVWALYSVPKPPAGTNPPTTGPVKPFRPAGNLRLFDSAGKPGLLIEKPTGLEQYSVLNFAVRPGSYSGGGQLLVSDESGACLWQADKKRIIARLPGKIPPLRAVFSEDGKLLALGMADGTIRLYNVVDENEGSEDKYRVAFRPFSPNPVTVGTSTTAVSWALAFSPGKNFLYVVKITGDKHLRARVRMAGFGAELFRAEKSRLPEDWATCVATFSGEKENEVCFAGLINGCHHLHSNLLTSEPTSLNHNVDIATDLRLVAPNVAFACNPKMVWVTDLERSSSMSAHILARKDITESATRRFVRVGIYANSLHVVVALSQPTERVFSPAEHTFNVSEASCTGVGAPNHSDGEC